MLMLSEYVDAIQPPNFFPLKHLAPAQAPAQVPVAALIANGRAYPPFSGNILLRLLNTSIVGSAFVPAARRSFSSRSFNLSELNARTLSACLPAVTTLRSILCTLSARWSTLNSTSDWTVCSRVLVVDSRCANDEAGSVRDSSIFTSSASRRVVSGSGASLGSPSSGYKGETCGRGACRARHDLRASFNLFCLVSTRRVANQAESTYRFMRASKAAIFSSCSTLMGFGLMTTGLFGAAAADGSSSLLNQSENSDLDPNSFNSASCIARAPSTAGAPAVPCFGFSLKALSPHHVRSCFILLGSLSPSDSICLKNSDAPTSRCGIALWPLSIRELARLPRRPTLLRRPPPAPAARFLRKSLFRSLIGVSLNGSAIFCAFGSLSRDLSTCSGVACESSCTGGACCFRVLLRTLFLALSSLDACLVPFVRFADVGAGAVTGSGPSSSSAMSSTGGDFVLRVGRFLGTTNGLSGASGEESSFLRVGRLEVLSGSSSSLLGGGGGDDAARLVPLRGLPGAFFAAAFAIGFGSGAGEDAGDDTVFCLFDPRVKRKSPSCSSYTAFAVYASDIVSNHQSSDRRP